MSAPSSPAAPGDPAGPSAATTVATPRSWRRTIRRILVRSALFAAVLVLLVVLRTCHAFRDRNPGFKVDLRVPAAPAVAQPRPLQAGFARAKISPDLSNPAKPVWMAGFSQNKPATAIHDDLWAMASVIDDGHTRLGVVVLDAIGFFHDDVIEVRRRLPATLKITYAVVCSTHNHNTPDLMGLWGPNPVRTGVDRGYRELVIQGAVNALSNAVNQLQPVRLALHEIPTPPDGLVEDTRPPKVYDSDLRLLHFTHPQSGATVGTLIGWGNHPETVWSRNTEITADFPGALRDALEHGVRHNGTLLDAGIGGIHVFVNGAVGGLMSTTPRVTVRDPYLEQDFKEPSHAKTLALGRQLARRILNRLESTNAPGTDHAPISIQARTIEIPIDNPLFVMAPVIGVIDRGHVRWKTLRTEVALLTLGQASIACIPGEIYPEIVNGGIESPDGADFPGTPVEVPPIRQLMPGRLQFVFGLANDEIGYILPKTEWDQNPPWLYQARKRHYGEVNSVGPEAGPLIHRAFLEFQRNPAHP